MKTDKIKLYVLEIFLLLTLLFALFVSNIFSRMLLACILFIYALMTTIFLLFAVGEKYLTAILTVNFRT